MTGNLKIEDKIVGVNDVGRKVMYTPPHLPDGSPESEEGEIISFNSRYVFVRFRGPNGEACNPSNLKWSL